MRRWLGVALGLLILWAAPVSATSPPEPTPVSIEQVADCRLPPPALDRLVQRLCDGEREFSAQELDRAFRTSARRAQVALARVAACHDDRALVPVKLQVFLDSKFSRQGVEANPDVYERLLRSLIVAGPDAIRAALPDLDLTWVADASWRSLERGWLAPVAGPGAIPPPSSAVPGGGDEAARQVLARLTHRDGLLALQADSGDRIRGLLQQLEIVHLAALVRETPVESLEPVLEVIRQRRDPRETLLAALEARIEERDLPSLRTARDELVARPAYLPAPPHLRDPRAALPPLDLGPRPAFVQHRSPRAWPLERLVLTGLLACLALWLVLVARDRRRRFAWFRLGAVLGPVALVITVEAALAARGVPPPGGLLDEASLTVSQGGGLSEVVLGGEVWIAPDDDQMRRYAFRPTPTPDTLRIVTLGESSAFGADYPVEDTFSHLLERRVAAARPDRTVEVLPGGVGGALSSRVRKLATEFAAYQPDLFVLYLGSNDVDFIPELTRYEGFDLRRLRFLAPLTRSRVLDHLRTHLPLLWPTEEFRGARFGPEPGPERRAAAAEFGAKHATRNLTAIVRLARSAGAETIIVAQGPRARVADIGRDAARRSGAVLVDGARSIEAHAQASGLQGSLLESDRYDDYYWDYVHPTRLGHAVLADAIAPAAVAVLADR